MKSLPLSREVLLSRIREIERNVSKLSRFRKFSLSEFKEGENFAIAEHYLRRALEAVFDIGNHILSRIPGVRVSTYKDVAIYLSKVNIVPENFAKEKLVKMAGYRNRLTHFYYEVTLEELYYILQNNLQDFEEFLMYIKKVLENPEEYGFSMI